MYNYRIYKFIYNSFIDGDLTSTKVDILAAYGLLPCLHVCICSYIIIDVYVLFSSVVNFTSFHYNTFIYSGFLNHNFYRFFLRHQDNFKSPLCIGTYSSLMMYVRYE